MFVFLNNFEETAGTYVLIGCAPLNVTFGEAFECQPSKLLFSVTFLNKTYFSFFLFLSPHYAQLVPISRSSVFIYFSRLCLFFYVSYPPALHIVLPAIVKQYLAYIVSEQYRSTNIYIYIIFLYSRRNVKSQWRRNRV